MAPRLARHENPHTSTCISRDVQAGEEGQCVKPEEVQELDINLCRLLEGRERHTYSQCQPEMDRGKVVRSQ